MGGFGFILIFEFYGPLAGEPVIIRRRIIESGGILFTLRYDDGRIREHEWFD